MVIISAIMIIDFKMIKQLDFFHVKINGPDKQTFFLQDKQVKLVVRVSKHRKHISRFHCSPYCAYRQNMWL